jgi:hypothetical protein
MLLKWSNMKNRLHEHGTMRVVGAMKGTSNVYIQGRPIYKFQIILFIIASKKYDYFLCGR